MFSAVSQSIKKGSELNSKDIRQLITSYVKENQLQNGRNVTLDPILTDVMTAGNTSSGKSNAAVPNTLAVDEIVQSVTRSMTKGYCIKYYDGRVLKRKGDLPCIRLHVAQKAANKKVLAFPYIASQ